MTDAQIAIEAMDLLRRSSTTVSRERVQEWLATRDPDVLSVVYEAVTTALKDAYAEACESSRDIG